jgi:hypothetical protein
MENVHMRKILPPFLLLVLLACCSYVFHKYAPPQFNPIKPLGLEQPIGPATYGKLTHLKKDSEACFLALDNAGVSYTRIEDSSAGNSCGFYDALHLVQSTTPYSATLKMTCAETAALFIWEKQAARPLADELFGSPIIQIQTYGSYSCRNINGSSRKSEHALANAIDISGFKLRDGRVINVIDHWGDDTPEGKFLKHLHARACRLFSVTLGPDYNSDHADHFHFDMGSGDLCE